MRIVTWNLRSATDRKWAHLEALSPDIAVLSEVCRDPRATRESAFGRPELSFQWEGSNAHKGLGLAGFGRPLARLTARGAIGRWSIASVTDGVAMLGIWSCPLRSGAYAAEVVRCLDAFEPVLARFPTRIVAGDLNVSGTGRGFAVLQKRLAEAGLVSAYHHFSGDAFGAEREMTIHPRHAGERGYHIDYCFVSPDLAANLAHVEIGSHDMWIASGLSDHAPVIVDIDWPEPHPS